MPRRADSLPSNSGFAREHHLSYPMRDKLWRLAQHKYGWGYAGGYREHQSFDALVRRGLVYVVESRSHERSRAYALTDEGLAECKRRWPVSPAVLGTYDHQPGGWTPVEGVR